MRRGEINHQVWIDGKVVNLRFQDNDDDVLKDDDLGHFRRRKNGKLGSRFPPFFSAKLFFLKQILKVWKNTPGDSGNPVPREKITFSNYDKGKISEDGTKIPPQTPLVVGCRQKQK